MSPLSAHGKHTTTWVRMQNIPAQTKTVIASDRYDVKLVTSTTIVDDDDNDDGGHDDERHLHVIQYAGHGLVSRGWGPLRPITMALARGTSGFPQKRSRWIASARDDLPPIATIRLATGHGPKGARCRSLEGIWKESGRNLETKTI